MDIHNKVAIITGGASGLGAATVRNLASSGARIAILDRNDVEGKKIASEVNGIFFDVDVSSEAQVRDAIEASKAQLGEPRILVNSAGIARGAEVLDDDGKPNRLQDFVDLVNVNLVGTYNCTRLFAAAAAQSAPMETGERGVVINVASIAGLDSPSNQSAYAASKAGVAGMTLACARSLAPWGIRVVTIAPGAFDTPILVGHAVSREDIAAAAKHWIPFPSRMGDPREFAELVAAICKISYINGEVIRIDGAGRAAAPRAPLRGN